MFQIRTGDCIQQMKLLRSRSVQCCVTSPPYFGLRDYGVAGQIGCEASFEEFVAKMVEVFRAVRRVLRDDGVLWVNLGDSYASRAAGSNGLKDGRRNRESRKSAGVPPGFKAKDLMLVPTTVAAALRADGWYLRDAMIWHKPNPMPTSQKDRCTFTYEYIFQFTKKPRYFFDLERVKEPVSGGAHAHSSGKRNKVAKSRSGIKTNDSCVNSVHNETSADLPQTRVPRNVRKISTQSFKGAHFATFPEALVELPIRSSTSLAGCCPQCRSPFVRQVEKTRRPTRPGQNTKVKMPDGWDTGQGGHGNFHRDGREKGQYRDTAEIGNRDPQRHITETKTVGWRPSCKCGVATESAQPCIVLDPFAGSGTTGVVALREGCDFIGIELNPEYSEMAAQRIKLSVIN